MVRLNLHDRAVNQYMVVERVTHRLTPGLHTMDLTLRGGDFVV